MKRHVAIATVVLISAALSYAGPITLFGPLRGANESPATPSAGTGTATVSLDTTLHTLVVDVVFSNLLPTTATGAPSGTTASHIHCCAARPGNAGVATTVPTFPGFPLGVDAGTYHQSFDLTLSSSYNPAFITANGGTVAGADAALENGLLNGLTYLNIHTNAFGGGEIRAFLTPASVPEPTTAALALLGLGTVWL